MTGIALFLKGVIVGFAIAAPVGPVGMLCVRRSLANGAVSGLCTGLGAAVADGFYGAVAAFGITAAAVLFKKYAVMLRIVGGVVLVLMAVRILLRRPDHAEEAVHVRKTRYDLKHAAGDFVSTLALTLANPVTLLAFMAVFAALGVGLGGPRDFSASVSLVGGVFTGSLACWCVLSGGVGLFRHRLGAHGMQLVNKLSALLLGSFGLLVLGYLAVNGGGK